jgi:hypothetical protein
MSTSLLNLLPRSCFVEFEAFELRSPRVLWRTSSSLNSTADCAHFALPIQGEPTNAFNFDKKRRYLGERYGGKGIGSNGGGVRCGFDGTVQVKGLGQNSLVGVSTEFFHSYGGCNLDEAVRDAIWGEICHAVLPYGAARAVSIVATGTVAPLKYENRKAESHRARALLNREAVVRPAHFLRAIAYAPRKHANEHVLDAERTRAAISTFGDIARFMIDDDCSIQAASPDYIALGLQAIFARFAAQLATARAKRIAHGALTPSNISIDGRWLDFTSCTALSDYGRVIVARGRPDFLREEMDIVNMARDLMFYFERYCNWGSGARKLPVASELIRKFQSAFEFHRQREFLKLTGATDEDLDLLNHVVTNRLYKAMSVIMCAGNSEPFKLLSPDPNFVPRMPSQMGRFHLPSVLRIAALSKNRNQLDRYLDDLLTDDELKTTFCDAYMDFRDSCEHNSRARIGSRGDSFRALNALRLNSSLDFLYRTVLNPLIECTEPTEDAVTQIISETVSNATFLLTTPKTGAFCYEPWFKRNLTASLTDGLVDGTVRISLGTALSSIASLQLTKTEQELVCENAS